MALVSGTQTRYDAVGLREDLENKIYNISPQDTPFSSSTGRKSCVQTLFEWQTDTLTAAAANAQLEGDDASFTTATATVRVGNVTQIMRKTHINSDTLDVVDKAGRQTEEDYQVMKRGAELKRDNEYVMLQNTAGTAGGVGTARTMASMGAWLKSAVSYATTSGGNPTYTSGLPSAARTDATTADLRAFTETILKAVVQSVWTNGGTPSVLMCGPVNRQRVSTFSGIATRNFDLSNVSPKATAIIGSADVYVSDFGTLRVIPNRFQRERDAWVLDWELLAQRVLRPTSSVRLAKTGDASKTLIIREATLQVKQEAGLGLAADLTTT